MYNASITIAQGTEREYGSSLHCITLKDAVEWIEHWAAGTGDCCRAWINNKEVRIKHCAVVDAEGNRLCVNEKWHEVFAKPSEQIKPLKPLRPLRVPTNPQTYLANGDAL